MNINCDTTAITKAFETDVISVICSFVIVTTGKKQDNSIYTIKFEISPPLFAKNSNCSRSSCYVLLTSMW